VVASAVVVVASAVVVVASADVVVASAVVVDASAVVVIEDSVVELWVTEVSSVVPSPEQSGSLSHIGRDTELKEILTAGLKPDWYLRRYPNSKH